MQGIAYALERTWADKSCRLADEKGTALASAYSSAELGTGNQASLGLFWCRENLAVDKAVCYKLLFLLLKGFAAILYVKSTAKDKHFVLEEYPRAARRGFIIKNAGIIRIRITCGKPLLNCDVFVKMIFLEK